MQVDQNRSELIESLSKWSLAVGLLVAIATGVALRLIWPGDIEYKGDEAWTFERVRAFLAGAPWPWVGMSTSFIVPHPGISVWLFIGLGKVFATRNAPELATAVQIWNIGAIIVWLTFARLALPAVQREGWYWAAALWALNPLAVIFERKIWPPSVLPLFMVAITASWWYRQYPIPAFVWGALGAAVGQVHTGAWLMTLALVASTALLDVSSRQTTRWRAWLFGNLAAGWPLIPWAIEILQNSGTQLPWKLRLFPLVHFFMRWVSQPFGFGIEYTLGSREMVSYLASPAIAGHPTHLMALAHIALVMLLLIVASKVAWRLRRTTSVRGIVLAGNNEKMLLQAALWGYGGLLTLITLFGPDSHRHYLIIVAPLMALWLVRLVFWGYGRDRANGARIILAMLCVAQGAASAGLLGYIHDKQVIIGEYGPTWRSQQPEPAGY